MNIIINHSSMQPIYEQIMGQIKERIMHGELKEDTALPSVRTFAKELKVSALTVKKAYDDWKKKDSLLQFMEKAASLPVRTRRRCWKKRKEKSKLIWRWPSGKAEAVA